MKIASKIKPTKHPTRDVTVHGKKYVFAPVEDKHGEVHYVADVKDEQAAETLMASPHFYAFGKESEKQPVLSRSSEQTPPPAKLATGDYSQEDVATATELLKKSIGEVGKDVASVTPAVVRAAIDVEKASQTPRKGMLDLLTLTLQGINEAGVKG